MTKGDFVISDGIKQTANYFLYDCGLFRELKKYEKPHIVGSYRMDMMAWNDLDIDIENDNMSLGKLYQLTTYILNTFHPTWYEAKQEVSDDGKFVWFHGFETVMSGELWNFDLWFLDKKKIENTINYCDDIAAKCSSIQKQVIIDIKKGLISRGMYSFEQYKSTDVYKAVIEQNVNSIEEFLLKYDKNSLNS